MRALKQKINKINHQIMAKGRIDVNAEKCKGCEVCVVNCPHSVIAMLSEVNTKGYHYAFMKQPENCTACTNCAIVCPDGAIKVYRFIS